MQANLIALYLAIASLVFCVLLITFWLDHSTPKTDKKSWAIVLLSTAFWFVVLPLSLLEITRKFLEVKRHTSNSNISHRNLG